MIPVVDMLASLDLAQELAEAEGISASDFVRLFIRRAHAEKFGDKKPPKKKR